MVGDAGPEKNNHQTPPDSFLKKVLIFVAVASFITILVLFIGYAIDILLLIFLGFLLGIIFRSLRDCVSKCTGMPKGLSLAVVVLSLLFFMGGTGYVLAPKIYEQAEAMYKRAPGEWNNIKRQLWQYSWGREIARENPEPEDLLRNGNSEDGENKETTTEIFNLFSLTAGAVVSIILVFVISIYIAAEPEVYVRGFLRLFPFDKRPLIANILDEISLIIQWWLVGQTASMVILGTITTLGLWLLGMPYSLILGIFTALMTFIPNLGPVIAGIPTLLVALTVSPIMVLYVFIFFTFIQSIEGYFITPMIHREIINVPPVLIITIQFLLYYLIGFIGVFVAMPLLACLMVIIQRAYVEEVLGDSMEREINIDIGGKTIL